MPLIHVELFEGRSPQQKKELVVALTDATCKALNCAPDAVDVILAEVKREHWATAGKLWSEKP
jgi:4-oxalocrotonate tautomerase